MPTFSSCPSVPISPLHTHPVYISFRWPNLAKGSLILFRESSPWVPQVFPRSSSLKTHSHLWETFTFIWLWSTFFEKYKRLGNSCACNFYVLSGVAFPPHIKTKQNKTVNWKDSVWGGEDFKGFSNYSTKPAQLEIMIVFVCLFCFPDFFAQTNTPGMC